VEDNPNDVLLFNSAFKNVGIENPLQVVPDGTALLQYLKGEGPYQDRVLFPLPKLILLKLDLPHMTGFQVLEWLRKQAEFRHMPVVVVTESVFSPEVTRAYRAGANSFVAKPQDLTEYPAALKQVLDFWLTHGQPPHKAAPASRSTPLAGASETGSV
jgi:CheY-like chemotaxis protein